MNRLAGRYALVSRIGQGGMGTVWRAFDELLHQEVAIKEVRLPPELDDAQADEMRERMLREARAAARLRSHPSIVTVHDVVLDGGRPWIIMELIKGRSLDALVRAEGPLPPPRVAAVGLAVLDALNAAHAMGVLHRDVKPGNVLITDDGRVLLTDFGIATVAGDVGLTQTGLLTGSPGYIAPERLRGEADGPPADLWSLGATLYTAAEGTPAFHRENQAAIMAAVLMYEPRPMHLAGPLTPLLAAILEKDPVRRCTAGQAMAGLQAIVSGASTRDAHTVPPVGPYALGVGGVRERTTHPSHRPVRSSGNKAPVIVGATLAVTLVTGAGFAVWRTGLIPSFGASKGPTSTATISGLASEKASPSAAPKAALLRNNPEACSLLTNVQARALLGGGPVTRQFMTKDACLWQRANGTFLEIQKFRLDNRDFARQTYDATQSTMKDQPKVYPGTKVRSARVVGDASFSWTRRVDVTSPNYQTQVLFLQANVMVTVFTSAHVPGYAMADKMARLVNAALVAAR